MQNILYMISEAVTQRIYSLRNGYNKKIDLYCNIKYTGTCTKFSSNVSDKLFLAKLHTDKI